MLFNAIIAVLIVVAAFLILRWPFVGLILMVSLIPGEELTIFSGKTLVWVLGVATAYSLTLQYLHERKEIIFRREYIFPALIFLLWASFSIVWAQDKDLAAHRIIVLMQLLLLFLLIQLMVTTNRRLLFISISYFISTVTFAVLAILITYSEELRRAMLKVGQNPNSLGRSIALGILLIPFLFGKTKRATWRFLLMLGAVAQVYAVLLTGSRSTWTGIIFSIFIVWIVSQRRIFRLRSIAVISLCLIIGIILLFNVGLIDEWYVERIKTIPSIEATRGGAGRINIWVVGWEMVKANPVLGVGIDNFPLRFTGYISRAKLSDYYGIYPGRDAHNIYLAVLAELGIIGIGLFLLLVWKVLKDLFAYRNDDRAMLGFLMVSFMLFTGFFEPVLYRKHFWLALGLAAVIYLIIGNEKDYREPDEQVQNNPA